MEKRNTISKDEKLKGRKATEELFALRQSFSVPPIRVFYRFTDAESGIVRVGFGAGKKYLRHAVRRNRAKRLMREAYRVQKHALSELVSGKEKSLHMFFLFSNRELINFSEMQNTFSAILQKMEKIARHRFTENV